MKKLRDKFFALPASQRIERFAWGLTAVIAIALIGLNWLAINTLSQPSWCAQIMSTEKYLGPETRLSSPQNISLIIEHCANTVNNQLDAIAFVAKVLAVAMGLIPTVVFVVKFSGANASGRFGGAEFDLRGRERDREQEALAKGAQAAADASQEEADEIKAGKEP